MLRKNFAGRKGARQQVALRGLEKKFKDPNHKPKRFKDEKPTKNAWSQYLVELKHDIKVLQERVAKLK